MKFVAFSSGTLSLYHDKHAEQDFWLLERSSIWATVAGGILIQVLAAGEACLSTEGAERIKYTNHYAASVEAA